MQPERTKNRLLVFILVTLSLVAILFSVENLKIIKQEKSEEARIEQLKTILDNTPMLAKAVSVYDLTQNKKVYGRNDEIAMPIASLAKTLTVAVALNAHRNNPQPDFIYITPDAINQAGDFGLFAYEKWKVNDLAKLTLLVSANDGIYTLAEGTDFLDKVNLKARKIGAEHAMFLNSTGLDLDPAHAGVFATAEDVNTMTRYALREFPEIYQTTRAPEINLKSESGFEHDFKNTNIIVDKIPNLIFSKTGFTDVAGGNLTVVFQNKKGEELAITLLGSTFEGRFSDMETLVNVLYSM